MFKRIKKFITRIKNHITAKFDSSPTTLYIKSVLLQVRSSISYLLGNETLLLLISAVVVFVVLVLILNLAYYFYITTLLAADQEDIRRILEASLQKNSELKSHIRVFLEQDIPAIRKSRWWRR